MIGSGIFLVDADIARITSSPALYLGAWVVTGILTLICALSYGELAAMMPRAGGQYVYLRESLGTIWGFLYGWTMLMVIQTGTIAAVAIAFSKFTAVLVPWFSASAWIWKIGTFGPWKLWFGSLGPYNVGLSNQNLLAVLSIICLTWVNTRGLHTGKIVHSCEDRSAWIACVGGTAVFNASGQIGQFREFLARIRMGKSARIPSRRPEVDDRNAHFDWRGNGWFALCSRCMEQCDVYFCRSEEPVAFRRENLAHKRVSRGDMLLDLAALLAAIVLQSSGGDSERRLNGQVKILHQGMKFEVFCGNRIFQDACLGGQGRFPIHNNFSSGDLQINSNMVQAAFPVMAMRHVYRNAACHYMIVKSIELFRFLADPFLNGGGRHHVPVSDLQRPFHKGTSCPRQGQWDGTDAGNLR
jgi:hypothetical protein